MYGQLAQLVEQRIENPRVRGSIPRLATNMKPASGLGSAVNQKTAQVAVFCCPVPW